MHLLHHVHYAINFVPKNVADDPDILNNVPLALS